MPASGISHNTKSPPNNIVVAQRAFLCLLLLTNNQSPGPGALKWKTFFDRQLSDPVRSVSFIQPVGNSIKTVSEHLPCALEPSVYAGLRDFANYSYSFTESMQTSVAHVLRQKSHHFDTLFCISLSSLKSAVPKMYPTPDVVTRVRGNISFPLPFLFFQPHSP